MGTVISPTPWHRLRFCNVALQKLPVDCSQKPGSRTVRGACYSRVCPQPLLRPRLVAVSGTALALLGVRAEEIANDPRTAEYLSGSVLMAGSEPAAHCYCGHQFGMFAGQLGDGAVCYLGEVREPESGQDKAECRSPSGRWEIQLKGAGLTPYSRQSDGRKVLRSSIREFLCSEAMFALGIPTTRAGSLVTSDLYVKRDAFYTGNPKPERCSVVLRIAPTFIRFGSFEIFNPADNITGMQGPSVGQHIMRAQLLDYVIETFYPEIQVEHTDRKSRNVAFFREVSVRTAKLVALWQCVGFCHGVLNTDNMSILGFTIDYGPFGFMDRFDPEFVSNASDKKRRYTFEAQPYVCHWNLARLAEALGSELQASRAGAILDEFMPLYEGFYLSNMRKKLGLLRREESEDGELLAHLLKVMHNTGADFTNTFRLLSHVSCSELVEGEGCEGLSVVDLILEQCASLEELKVANHPPMEPQFFKVAPFCFDDSELEMILSMAETNPELFNITANQPEVSKQLEKIGRLKELLHTNQEDLKAKHKDDWLIWMNRYRKRLSRECDGDPAEIEKERVKVMNSINPEVVLRNYIAQNAIEWAEDGEFSEVQKLLKVLENPYSVPSELKQSIPSGRNRSEVKSSNAADCERKKAPGDISCLPYNCKPPEWAREICVT